MYIAVIMLIVWANLFVLRVGIIHGNSMYPALRNRSIVLFWQWRYTPQVGDIVMLGSDTDFGSRIVKRIAAINGQYVYIDEMYFYVPKGYVFLIGDNRDESRDSRHYGPVREEAIVGRVFLVYNVFRGDNESD